MLERTLESSGRLSFEAPDTFVRETLKPRRDRVAVVGNTLTMSRGEPQPHACRSIRCPKRRSSSRRSAAR